jgi:AcrR family transcriptional regulator
MKKKLKASALKLRKAPGQSRSIETVNVILEAAARILEERGFAGYTTNAVAERAGVSIGSLYQYFPNKDALTVALIDRETAQLIAEAKEIGKEERFREGLERMIHAAVTHQMQRPKLARLIDFEEHRLPIGARVAGVSLVIHSLLVNILGCVGAPVLESRTVAAFDLLAIIKGIVDGAGERRERDAEQLEDRVRRAVFGYLSAGGADSILLQTAATKFS